MQHRNGYGCYQEYNSEMIEIEKWGRVLSEDHSSTTSLGSFSPSRPWCSSLCSICWASSGECVVCVASLCSWCSACVFVALELSEETLLWCERDLLMRELLLLLTTDFRVLREAVLDWLYGGKEEKTARESSCVIYYMYWTKGDLSLMQMTDTCHSCDGTHTHVIVTQGPWKRQMTSTNSHRNSTCHPHDSHVSSTWRVHRREVTQPCVQPPTGPCPG